MPALNVTSQLSAHTQTAWGLGWKKEGLTTHDTLGQRLTEPSPCSCPPSQELSPPPWGSVQSLPRLRSCCSCRSRLRPGLRWDPPTPSPLVTRSPDTMEWPAGGQTPDSATRVAGDLHQLHGNCEDLQGGPAEGWNTRCHLWQQQVCKMLAGEGAGSWQLKGLSAVRMLLRIKQNQPLVSPPSSAPALQGACLWDHG